MSKPILFKKYNDISEIWKDFSMGRTIYWKSKAYKLYASTANCDYQNDHFTNKDGQVLSIRCIENYFGGLMDIMEMDSLYLEINRVSELIAITAERTESLIETCALSEENAITFKKAILDILKSSLFPNKEGAQ